MCADGWYIDYVHVFFLYVDIANKEKCEMGSMLEGGFEM